MSVIIGRPINGISLNGLEYAQTDDGEILIFDDRKKAENFLLDSGVIEDDLWYFTFVESIGTCFRCGSPLFPSDIEGYTSQCFHCDEDFYSFEQGGCDNDDMEV